VLKHIFAFDSHHPLLFTQLYFWVFFTIVYALFALIVEVNPRTGRDSRRLHLRNIYLMLVSWFFYYKTSGIFLAILLFLTLSDWLLAKRIYQSHLQNRPSLKRLWLVLGVCIDLGILAFFKYTYFGADAVNQMFGTHLTVTETIILPVGISFYIFQVISYTADVYHGRIRPVDNLLDFGFYVSFFPQLVAGPIVRASEFVPQLYRPFRLSRRMFGVAVFWILNGLAKKIILSDYLATHLIDRVFENPLLFSGFENLFALFAYSLQVYADFSGYTDIAIGVALLMGFHLPQNFNSPYKAQNPQEFWRRWHMSLSRWLKTYLYIPLGGNRNATVGTWILLAVIAVVGTLLSGSLFTAAALLVIAVVVALVAWKRPSHRKLMYANLNSFITMLLGGLWHGASWNFLIWGGLNGIGMIVNKFWREMNRHLRMLVITLGAGAVFGAAWQWHLPVLRLFAVWGAVLWAGTAVRYLWSFLPVASCGFTSFSGKVWAVAQTFVFITFTRLFFRSGSNLDPATANQVAWETAKNMVTQIGGAWNNQIIIPFLWEYRSVVLLFVLGMLIHWLPAKFKTWYRLVFAHMPLWLMMLCTVTAIVILYQFVTAEAQPFIYFQF